MSDGLLCPRPVHPAPAGLDPQRVCLMHSRDPDKDKALFREEIDAILNGTSTHHRAKDMFDFTRFVFPEANFSGARFTRAADFREATFTQDADFRGATFTQAAKFFGATFTGAAHFFGAKFKGQVSFEACRFRAGVDFQRARFGDEADFVETEFGGNELFEYYSPLKTADFKGAATFFEAIFGGKVYFAANRFAGPVDFARAHFADAGIFSSRSLAPGRRPEAATAGEEQAARLTGEPSRSETLADGVPPAATRRAEVPGSEEAPPEICFEDVFLDRPERFRFENFSLERTTFVGTNLRQMRFHNPRWPRKGRRVALYDELRPNPADPEMVRLLYRDLKANLEDARDWVAAGEFYYAEMELRRKAPRSGKDPWRWLRRYFSPYTLYWLAGGYGERPLRVLLFFGFLVLLFAALFHQQAFLLDTTTGLNPPTWTACLGHSLRALTLQRTFYIQPDSDWAHRLTLLASIIGPVQLGLLAIALRRRFRR